jgi:predicted ATPase
MPSKDSRFRNARQDIEQHRLRNIDWDDDWVFYDDRFNLLKCSDEAFLAFLSETLHPIVRPSADDAYHFADLYNEHLRVDDHEIAPIGELSEHPVFAGRRIGKRAQREGRTTVYSVSRLSMHGWRQLGNIEITFHDRLTILTGANGAGKSTILRLLSSQMGWHPRFAGLPAQFGTAIRYVSSIWSRVANAGPKDSQRIASIQFGNSRFTELYMARAGTSANFDVTATDPVTLIGIFIPSHRPIFEGSKTVRFAPGASLGDYFNRYIRSVQSMWSNSGKANEVLGSLKGALLSGDSHLIADFSERLRLLMPEEIGFDSLNIIGGTVFVSSRLGPFTLEAASGGVASIVDMAWQIYASITLFGNRGVVLIDEPENHLHPRMQRTLLPKLLEAFPALQFIVATHSPLIISSVQDATVYVLKLTSADPERFADGLLLTVESSRLDRYSKSGTTDDILQEVLGIEYAMPQWAAAAMLAEIDLVKRSHYTQESISRFEEALAAKGLERYTGLALEKMSSDTLDQ